MCPTISSFTEISSEFDFNFFLRSQLPMASLYDKEAVFLIQESSGEVRIIWGLLQGRRTRQPPLPKHVHRCLQQGLKTTN